MNEYTAKDINNFWSKVKLPDTIGTNECWEWQASLTSTGYGQIWLSDKRHYKAHRLAWMIVYGRITSNQHVLHRCDNPLCVRPDHLFIGTQHDNMLDMNIKHRHAAKLSVNQVIQIRALKGKKTYEAIGAQFGVKKSIVGHIMNNQAWRLVQEE